MPPALGCGHPGQPPPMCVVPAGVAAFGGRLRVLVLRGGPTPPPEALVALSALRGLRVGGWPKCGWVGGWPWELCS